MSYQSEAERRERTECGVRIRRGKGTTNASWFGWGTGYFISWMLLFPLPVLSLMMLVVWMSQGMPAPRTPLATEWLVVIGVIAAWNTAALLANHRNRVRVTMSEVVISQGIVPWPIAFRRRRVAIKDVREIDIADDWDPESEHTVYRVIIKRRDGGNVRVSGATNEKKARAIATELVAVLKVPLAH